MRGMSNARLTKKARVRFQDSLWLCVGRSGGEQRWVMVFRITKHLVSFAVLCIVCFSNGASAQWPTANPTSTTRQGEAASPLEGSIEVYVKGADGGPIEGIAMVTLVA